MQRLARFGLSALALVVVVLAGFTIHGFVLLAQKPDPFAHLVPPPPGPRAPIVDVIGLRVGDTTLVELHAWLDARSASCSDTATIAKSDAAPAAVAPSMPKHPSAGGTAPAGACPFKLDAGQQVRLTCKIDAAKLGARFADTSQVELTFLLDSEDHPLRYVMIDRKLRSQSATHGEWTRATSAWRDVLGEPSAQSEEPTQALEGQKPFPRFKLFRQEWRYSDRRFEVQAMNFGPKKGIDVREVVEIPWPIRSL
jgi:hypothetical protein